MGNNLTFWKGEAPFQKVRKRMSLFTFHWFPSILKGATVLCAAALVTLMFSEVWLRYVFHLPLQWIGELIVIPALWLYWLGASYGAYNRSHIKVTLMDYFIKNKRRKSIFHIVTSCITFAISILFVWWGYAMFYRDLALDPRSYTLLLPLIYARSSIFFGSIFISFYYLVQVIDLVGQHFGKAPLLSKERS